MTILKIKKNKKYFLLTLLFYSKTLPIENELPQENNIEHTVIASEQNKEIPTQDVHNLFIFLQKTFVFLTKNKVNNVNIVNDILKTFTAEERKNFNKIMEKFMYAGDDSEPEITPQSFHIIFKFIFDLITKINTDNNLNLTIPALNFSAISKDPTILVDSFNNFSNALPEITNLEHETHVTEEGLPFDQNIIDSLNDLTSRIAMLLKKSIDNLEQKNYNKSLIQNISKKYFTQDKTEALFDLQFSQLLKQFTEECLQTIQENVLILNNIRNDFFSLSEKKQYEYITEILEKNLFVLSFMKYEIEKQFLPSAKEKAKFLDLEKKLKELKKSGEKGNKKITKKIQALESEQKNLFMAMQDQIIRGTKESSKAIKGILYKKNNQESINQTVERLISLVRNLSEQEQSLCYYLFQNIYRGIYFNTQNFLEKNIFTKSFKYLLVNPAKLFSAYFAYDMYKYLNPARPPQNAYTSMIVARMIEIYKELHSATTTLEKTYHMDEQEFFVIHDQMILGSEMTQRHRIQQLDATIESLDRSLDHETNQSKKEYYQEQKNKFIEEKDSLTKQLANAVLMNNFSTENAEVIEVKKTILNNKINFQDQLTKGKYKDYSNQAKLAIQNNVTKKELENPHLLEKRYTQEYMKKNKIEKLSPKDISEIQKNVEQSIEIVKAYQQTQLDNLKLMTPYLNPYPFRSVGKNISMIGKAALPVTAGISGLVVHNYLKKAGSLFEGVQKFFENIHLLAMGEKVTTENNIKLIQEGDFKYNLYDKTFDVWRSQGLLDSLHAVVKDIKKTYPEPYATISKELDRAFLVCGDSGSGKTTLVKGWVNSVFEAANQSKVEVEFFEIDPKMFTKEVETGPGRYEKMDIFAEAKAYLKSIKFANKIVIIHIDEAHLLLGTNEGTFSLTRWADLLNFITSLNDEQRKNKSRGAMFVIASTNRPDILPPELLKNPNRFSNIIEIPIPSYADRISIFKGYLQNLGMQTDIIDFEYLSGLLEGTNQSYGNVLRIVQKAVVFAKIHNSMVTTDIMYKFINELIRNVTFTINKLDPYFIDQISSYYGAIASVAMQFEKIQNLYCFDMATIYPLKNEIESKNISELYTYPKPKPIQYGEVFYCKRSFQIDDFNKKTVILSLIADLVGNAYCETIETGLPKQAQKKLAHAYNQIYEYFASSSAEFAHIATELQKSKEGDSKKDITLTKKTTEILRKIEAEIKKFVQQPDVKQLIEKTKELLQNKKMITKKDMLEQNEIKDLLIKTEKEFKTLYNTIKNLIV